MRLGLVLLCCLTVSAALPALAQTDSDEAAAPSEADQARDRFEAELVRQCPEKELELLSARDLRDGLDNYMAGLSQDMRDRFEKSETDHCSSMDSGAACVNLADIAAADEVGRMEDLAASICGSFLRCRDQGVCDYAR